MSRAIITQSHFVPTLSAVNFTSQGCFPLQQGINIITARYAYCDLACLVFITARVLSVFYTLFTPCTVDIVSPCMKSATHTCLIDVMSWLIFEANISYNEILKKNTSEA